jgi:hypothetical protein
MYYGGGGAAAQAAAIARAIKASGTIVRVDPDEFLAILSRAQEPLVVCAPGGLFRARFMYLTSYKGLAFFCRSNVELDLPAQAEVVIVGKIWIP